MFGNGDKHAPLLQSGSPDPTLNSIRAQLEEIGRFRLQLKDAEMKVLVTQIAWNGERFLERQSTTGTPSAAQLIKATHTLDTAFQVIRAFAQHERAPLLDQENQDRLAHEKEAVQQFATSLTEVTVSAGFAASMNADVNTELLQRLTQNP